MFLPGVLLALLTLSQPPEKIELKGTVTTYEGKPLAGVTVSVDSAAGDVTDAGGRFSFETGGGERTINVSYLGYQVKDTSLVVNGSTGTINIPLREEALPIEDVVITGSRVPRALKDTPVVTRVITSNQISSISPQSLSDILEMELPGIEFTMTEGQRNSIRFQGLDADYLLILVDGQRLAGETSRGNPDFNRIDIDNIERIEVIKGAMSTLYGSGAVAGIINIITKQSSKPLHALVNARYDSEGEQKYGVSVGSLQGDWNFRTNGLFRLKNSFYLHNSEPQLRYYEDGTTAVNQSADSTAIEGYRNYTVEQIVGYKINRALSAELRGGFYHHDRFNAGDNGAIMRDHYRDWNIDGKLIWDFNTADRLEATYRVDDYSKFTNYLKKDSVGRSYRNVIHNPKLIYINESWRRNLFIAGAEVLSESLETYQFAPGEQKHMTTVSTYIQDEYKFDRLFTLQAGVRADWHNRYGWHVSPSLSAMARVSNWRFRAGYASGFRTPTLKELYTQWDHQGMFELIGNQNLDPEKSHNVSVSVEYAGPKLNITAGGFYNKIYDKIGYTWNNTSDTLYYKNITDTKVAGADINFGLNIGRQIALRASYAYVNDMQKDENGFNTSSTRPHTVTGRIDYNFRLWKIPFTAGLSARYMSKVDLYTLDSSKGMYYYIRYESYTICKFNFSTSLPRGIRINAGVNNLLNYKPKYVTYNAGITRGVTFFASVSIALDELSKKSKR